jgi:DNA polymerase III delta prime subunit
MIWERHKPIYLSDITHHQDTFSGIQNLVDTYRYNNQFVNLIIYGTEESGKMTLVRCMLASMFGKSIYKLTCTQHSVRQNCSNYNINIYRSNHHYEISFAGLQYADRCVLSSVMDDYFNTSNVVDNTFKLLVIRDFHLLTKPAQYSLRRRIETHYQAVRFIIVTSCINKIEPAIISRCLSIRCPKPTISQLKSHLVEVCKKESIRIDEAALAEISTKSGRNIGKSLYYLEIIKNTGKTDLVSPQQMCIQRLLDCFQSKDYPCEAIREAISNLQLAKIGSSKIFRELLDWVCLNIKDQSQIMESVECIAKYELISNKYNRFSIAMETTMITLFNIYRKDT